MFFPTSANPLQLIRNKVFIAVSDSALSVQCRGSRMTSYVTDLTCPSDVKTGIRFGFSVSFYLDPNNLGPYFRCISMSGPLCSSRLNRFARNICTFQLSHYYAKLIMHPSPSVIYYEHLLNCIAVALNDTFHLQHYQLNY